MRFASHTVREDWRRGELILWVRLKRHNGSSLPPRRPLHIQLLPGHEVRRDGGRWRSKQGKSAHETIYLMGMVPTGTSLPPAATTASSRNAALPSNQQRLRPGGTPAQNKTKCVTPDVPIGNPNPHLMKPPPFSSSRKHHQRICEQRGQTFQPHPQNCTPTPPSLRHFLAHQSPQQCGGTPPKKHNQVCCTEYQIHFTFDGSTPTCATMVTLSDQCFSERRLCGQECRMATP